MKKTGLTLALAALLALPFGAQAWEPTSDINVIVAYKAGSGTDTGARLLASLAEKNLGKTMIINNLPGADGKIGWTRLTKAKPDGHTIGFINLPTFTSLAALPGAPFKVSQVVPLANHLSEASVVVVRGDSKIKSLDELVKAARENSKLRASTNGVKASNHTAAQLFASTANFKYKAIPYGGTADQLLALRQGEVDFSCAKVADIAKFSKGDKAAFRVLGVYSEKRLAQFPDVPTLGEKGFYDKWYGSARALVAPAGTPKDAVEFYVKAFEKTLTDPAVIEAHKKAGMNLDFRNDEALGKLIQEQEVFAREVISKLY